MLFLSYPQEFKPDAIAERIEKMGTAPMIIYLGVTLIRGFFLIPSTPFVLCGVLLFPNQLFLVLIISMLGVLFSATLLYYFADLLGFSKKLEAKNVLGIQRWKKKLQKPQSGLFVLLWSFFPLVPTDLICYVAGLVKMRFLYFILGVGLGELTLNIVYIYFGGEILAFF